VQSGVRQSGTALEPSTTPPSISSTMWALQSSRRQSVSGHDNAKAHHNAVIGEFSELANMTPAERVRAQMLERLGLTEDDLEGMPKEVRESIEKQIADEIKKQLTGVDDKSTDDEASVITA
jgi:uncharacterized FlaG/YvyC family protein